MMFQEHCNSIDTLLEFPRETLRWLQVFKVVTQPVIGNGWLIKLYSLKF